MSFPRYERYKESGVEWLGEVPEGWEVKRLRFVAELNPSKTEISHLDRETLVSFLPMGAIGDDGSLDLEQEKAIREVETGYTFFRDGDVTVAKITPCFENGKGAVMKGLLRGVGFGTTELIVARPKQGETNASYLHWLFISAPFRNIGESYMYGAGGQKRVPDDFVRDFPSPFPPLPEQQTIAAFLDRETGKIDALVAEQQRLIELLKEKRQAVISHAVTKGLNPAASMKDSGVEWLGEVPAGWEVVPIKAVSVLFGRIGYRGYTTEDIVNEGEGAISLSPCNMVNGELEFSKSTFISWDKYKESPEIMICEGDVLIVKTGSTIGKVAYVRSLPVQSTINPQIAIFKNISCAHRFLYYFLTTQYLQSLVCISNTGGTIPTMTQESIGNHRIALPPVNEQQLIVDFLDTEAAKLDTLITEAERAIALLKERRTALISAAVTGKIKVTA